MKISFLRVYMPVDNLTFDRNVRPSEELILVLTLIPNSCTWPPLKWLNEPNVDIPSLAVNNLRNMNEVFTCTCMCSQTNLSVVETRLQIYL